MCLLGILLNILRRGKIDDLVSVGMLGFGESLVEEIEDVSSDESSGC